MILCRSLIDELIAKRIDRDPGTTPSYPYQRWDNDTGEFFFLCDHQYSVIATLRSDAALHSRVTYDAYGNGSYRADGDLNRDGVDWGTDDVFQVWLATQGSIGSSAYLADTDINRDGEADFFDLTVFTNSSGDPSALPGRVTVPTDDDGPDCSVGYAGYFQMPELGTYSVRYRVYDPALGRWFQRDPAGYVDGMGLYQYVKSHATVGVDPSGLEEDDVRTQDMKMRAVCVALKNAHESGQSLEDFTKQYVDSPGEFYQTIANVDVSDNFAPMNWGYSPDVDLDWMITLLAVHYHGHPVALGFRYGKGLDPYTLYVTGKTAWVSIDGIQDSRRRNIMKRLFGDDEVLFGNENEWQAARMADSLIGGDATLADVYNAIGCDQITGSLGPVGSTEKSATSSTSSILRRDGRNARRNQRQAQGEDARGGYRRGRYLPKRTCGN